MAKEKEKPLKESIIVDFEHLNPALQKIIGVGRLAGMNPSAAMFLTIRGDRFVRGLSELSLLNLSFAMNVIIANNRGQLSSSELRSAYKLFLLGGVPMATLRTVLAKDIQKKHQKLVESMKGVGILKPGRIESKYPEGWLNPSTVAKTHPVFYVKGNGDLIFPKMTRTEYARFVFQKRWPGKLGLNPWRWRAYLESPERPEKVTDFVNAKIRQWLATMRPKPAFGIATARTKVTGREKSKGRRRRKI